MGGDEWAPFEARAVDDEVVADGRGEGASGGVGEASDPLAQYASMCVVLYTSMTRDQLATVAHRKIVTQLEGLKADFVQIDGIDPNHKAVRAALWAKAGAKPGTYPILYIGPSGFTCKGDEVQGLIDSGELSSKLGLAAARDH